MPTPDYAGAIAYALDRLAKELPAERTYHNLFHTRDDVMIAAVRLAGLSGCSEAETRLLEVAAAFHDIGVIGGAQEHEMRGMRIVAQQLPRFGFSGGQIEQIMGMIMATRLPQTPHYPLEELLADADLDVLGRDDFMPRNRALLAEVRAYGTEISLVDWYRGQSRFLQSHTYWSDAACRLRNPQKQQHVELLHREIEKLMAEAAT